MLQFFRRNDPYRLVWIFVILILIRVTWIITGLPVSMPELKWLLLGERLGNGFVMYSETFDYTGPLAAMVYKWLDVVFGANRWVHIVFSTILVILQAGILNSILLKNKAFDENNYLPAFLYVIVMSSIPDFFVLSPQLMSLTFVILSLNHIFRRIDNIVTDELFLYGGLYTGLATFFYLPSFIYFLAFLFSFVVFSSAILRRLVIFIYGFFVVALVIVAYYFWHDSLGDLWNGFVLAGINKPKTYFLEYSGLLEFSYVIIAATLISLSVFITARATSFQMKMIRVMTLFLLAAGVTLIVSPELGPAELLFAAPPLAFLLTHFFLNLQRRLFKIIMPYLIILLLLIYPWYTRYDSDTLVVEDVQNSITAREVMLLGSDLTIYIGNGMASPFLDEYSSKYKLEGLDYFSEAARLYEIIDASDPEVIIDHWGAVPDIFERFPAIESQYERRRDGNYWKINS